MKIVSFIKQHRFKIIFSTVGVAFTAFAFFVKLPIDIYPVNTRIGDVNIGLKNQNTVNNLIQNRLNRLQEENINLDFKGQIKQTTLSNLGVEYNTLKTLEKAEKTFPKQKTLAQLIYLGGKTIDPVFLMDEEKIWDAVDPLFSLTALEPKSATFVFTENKNIESREGKSGIRVDKSVLFEDVKKIATTFKNTKVSFVTSEEKPKYTAEQIEADREIVEKLIKQKITLIDPIYSDDWLIDLYNNLDWIYFEEADEKNKTGELKYLSLRIKEEKLNEFLDKEVSKWLDRPADPVNIFKDKNEKIVIEGTGADGLSIEREKLKKTLEQDIVKQNLKIEIPVQKITPTITVSDELEKLGIKERVGIGHTSYYGSPANRVHNVKVSAEKFNGKLLAPDEVFSFNKTLGPVDGAHGYKKELVIKKEGTIPEYGGGICQVSTTVYRAILLSALPIVERHPHSYAVSYYSQVLGHGLDATIYLGGPDLKFKNDTGSHLLMQTYVKNDYELYVVFYGTNTGKTVELEGPYLSKYTNPGPTEYITSDTLAPGQKKQLEKPHTGFSAVWYRYITDKNGKKEVETINSRYKAVPAKIMVGPEPQTPEL